MQSTYIAKSLQSETDEQNPLRFYMNKPSDLIKTNIYYIERIKCNGG
jgi:hypothetical protein